ncbi:MAG TPA: DsbA family protein [Anaerolineales bacterium]
MNDNMNTPQTDTITFKRTHFYSALVVLAFAAGVLVGYMAWGRGAVAAAPAVVQNPTAQGPVAEVPITPEAPQYVRYDIPTEGSPSLGPDEAPITIVEFSDFQCPFCRRFHQETYQSLLDAYPGQIRFVYRQLPLTSIHPEAFPAAVAALCANEQNAFWPYHDKLFSSEQLGRDVYVQYATDLELDTDAFQACLDSGRNDPIIQADSDFAINLGVNSTPTFFVNGLAIIGAQPLEAFKQIIDKEIAGEIP